MKLFVINGPNLNMLGIREKTIYGSQTYADLLEFVIEVCQREKIEVECFQSNYEGELVGIIQNAYGVADGIIINPAAYTHTSIAILDALKAVAIPAIEVHLSDITKREDFRRISYPAQACLTSYYGLGFDGYKKAILHLKKTIEQNQKESAR